MRGQLSMRASTADRERAVDVLRAAFTEGRLTQEEHTDRVEQAYKSRTYGELEALTADLPTGPLGTMAHPGVPVPVYPAPLPQPRTNSMAVASLVFGVSELFTLGLTAIPAIVLGHVARREIRRTGEGGDGLATAGIILGWAAVGLFTGFLIVLSIVAASAQAHQVVINPGGGLVQSGTSIRLMPEITSNLSGLHAQGLITRNGLQP